MTNELTLTCIHEWNLIALPEQPTIYVICGFCSMHLREHLGTGSDPVLYFTGTVGGLFVMNGQHESQTGSWTPVDVYVRASSILNWTGNGYSPQQEYTVRLTSRGVAGDVIEGTFVEG